MSVTDDEGRVNPSRSAPASGRLVDASIEVLKAGQDASGAFVASPTFAPYAYCWLRDGSFCAAALDAVGEQGASRRYHDWVADVILAAEAGIERAIARADDEAAPPAGAFIECRYRLDGTPVDDGWPTFQLDGPGMWLWALARHLGCGGTLSPRLTDAADLTTRYLARFWSRPCWDAWEEFGDRVHTSTLAAIRAGLSAAQAIVATDGSCDEAIAAIDRHPTLRSSHLTKWEGSDEVDASLLWLVWPYRQLRPTDEAFARTLGRIERELVSPVWGVHRYASDSYYGGGAWPVLTAALGGVYAERALPGDLERAWAALGWIEDQADDDGRLPEQVDHHLLWPARRGQWLSTWGPPAHPLLWSHAAYLELHVDLARARTQARP